ncbi:hypothetical protein GCM10007857_54990 [Bradyrhizobium iriomotense]|uniref:FMN hydroxy acid dehydrogenase domain-containing protein n=1 Tax=Bradyrhizobium iriomotense TaxID=441950 RepID=A0ABQ6B5N1_9BRAD|nr:hypothetical protein GCM10007857_54990 [Bradyrhizobium iriomotense]
MRALLNADDYRGVAQKFLPRGLFDYIDRGTEDEVALKRLRASLDEITLTPSVLTGHDRRSFDTTLLGRRLAAPLIVAPTALAGLVAHDGETKLARAASRVGIPVCISTQSVTTVETIRRGARDATLWFQLYVWRHRALTARLLERARACGCETLVVTVDTPVSPNREYNKRNGFGIPFVPSLRSTLDVALHPRWLVSVSRAPSPERRHADLRTLSGRVPHGDHPAEHRGGRAARPSPQLGRFALAARDLARQADRQGRFGRQGCGDRRRARL